MSINDPGKYDDECALIMGTTLAEAVFLLVVNGEHGSGVSLKTVNPEVTRKLPRVLRILADDIERDEKSNAT